MIENKNMSNCPKNAAEAKTDYLGETFGTKDVNAQMKAKSYDVLTKYMDELNIGLGTLSDLTGISKSTISRYRNGKVTYMTASYLYAICIALRFRTCQQRYLLKCAHISMPDEWGNERASAFIIRDFLDGYCYDENYTVANCNTRLAEINAPLRHDLSLQRRASRMGKFFYKHFGDDVPLYIEREYNRLLIQEHNQEIKEQKNRVQTLNFDEVTKFFPNPFTIPVSEHELEKHRLDADRLEYLPIALKLLEIEHPDLYELMTEYFLSAEKVTFTALARSHNVSVDKIRYKIGLAKKRLKEYYDVHENKG